MLAIRQSTCTVALAPTSITHKTPTESKAYRRKPRESQGKTQRETPKTYRREVTFGTFCCSDSRSLARATPPVLFLVGLSVRSCCFSIAIRICNEMTPGTLRHANRRFFFPSVRYRVSHSCEYDSSNPAVKTGGAPPSVD